MMFHASIPADNPQRVAEAIAEIWGGEAFRFPPWPGAYVAMAGDDRSSTVEVYPRTQTMVPGEDEQPTGPRLDESPRQFVAFHIAIGSPKTVEEVIAIGEREGWRTKYFSRGDWFDVIELWVENRVLVEVMTEDMQVRYRKNVNLEMWRWTKETPTSAT